MVDIPADQGFVGHGSLDLSPDGSFYLAGRDGGRLSELRLSIRRLFVASLPGCGVRRVADSAWCCAYWGDDGQLYYVTLSQEDGPARTLFRTVNERIRTARGAAG